MPATGTTADRLSVRHGADDVVDLDWERRRRRRFGQPSSFGLTRHELTAEIRRCRRAGWQTWEIRVRFIDPRSVAS
jgi:hypothetical protein